MTILSTSLRRFAPALLAIALGMPSAARAQSLSKWERFDFAHRRVDSAAVDQMALADLRSLRGIIFGKHGVLSPTSRMFRRI